MTGANSAEMTGDRDGEKVANRKKKKQFAKKALKQMQQGQEVIESKQGYVR